MAQGLLALGREVFVASGGEYDNTLYPITRQRDSQQKVSYKISCLENPIPELPIRWSYYANKELTQLMWLDDYDTQEGTEAATALQAALDTLKELKPGKYTIAWNIIPITP